MALWVLFKGPTGTTLFFLPFPDTGADTMQLSMALGGLFPLISVLGLRGLLCHQILSSTLLMGFWFSSVDVLSLFIQA